MSERLGGRGDGLAVGVDVGGTKIEAALVDGAGAVRRQRRIPAPATRQALLDAVCALVDEVAGDASAALAGVGFAIPGSLDPQSGLLRNAPNSPQIEGTPFGRDLRARLPWRLAFENDANCLIVSEQLFGAARGVDDAVGVILGTGVGAGVLIGGRLISGHRGLAPEPGHLPLRVGGRACKCGLDGCVEAYLSGPSVLARYLEAGGATDVGGTAQVFERATAGDAVAAAVVEETLALFCRFVAMLVLVYDPARVVLGGGLSQQPALYAQQARIDAMVFGSLAGPEVVRAAGGDASGKLGAAALILREGGTDASQAPILGG